jgi:AraC-like DNA-binding protein
MPQAASIIAIKAIKGNLATAALQGFGSREPETSRVSMQADVPSAKAAPKACKRRRIDLARTLLRDPKLQIGEVALAVGYQTASAFASAFRRETGVTPSQYSRCL